MRRFFGCGATFKALAAATLIVATVGGQARAGLTIQQGFAVGPNGLNGSPSFPGWVSNTIAGLSGGFVDVGDFSTDPTAFHLVTSTSVRDVIPTVDFNSWRGNASPTGAFASELGNLLFTPVVINGGGAKFSLSQVVFSAFSSDNPGDPNNSLLGSTLDFQTAAYNAGRVGVIHHVGGADTFVASGDANQLVDELIYRGVGAYDVPLVLAGSGKTGQQLINQEILHLSSFGDLTFTATYTIYKDSVSRDQASILLSHTDSIVVAAASVPEPSTFAAMAAGGLILFVAARRRKASATLTN